MAAPAEVLASQTYPATGQEVVTRIESLVADGQPRSIVPDLEDRLADYLSALRYPTDPHFFYSSTNTSLDSDARLELAESMTNDLYEAMEAGDKLATAVVEIHEIQQSASEGHTNPRFATIDRAIELSENDHRLSQRMTEPVTIALIDASFRQIAGSLVIASFRDDVPAELDGTGDPFESDAMWWSSLSPQEAYDAYRDLLSVLDSAERRLGDVEPYSVEASNAKDDIRAADTEMHFLVKLANRALQSPTTTQEDIDRRNALAFAIKDGLIAELQQDRDRALQTIDDAISGSLRIMDIIRSFDSDTIE